MINTNTDSLKTACTTGDININNLDNTSVIVNNTLNKYDINRCCAGLSSNPHKQCSFKKKFIIDESNQYGLCTRHYKIGYNNIFNVFTNSGKQLNRTRIKRQNINNYTESNINSIIKLQKHIRGFIVKNNIYYKGISLYCRHLCNNRTDCTTFLNIEEVPFNEYFSYCCTNNHHWGFNIATFKELLKFSDCNPYDQCKIDNNVINKFNKLLNKLNREFKIEADIITDPTIKLHQRCVSIFQMMDNLKQYTQCNWFLDLNLVQMKELYKQLEDLWNYRINLSLDNKKKYVKSGILFEHKILSINKITSRIKLANILLDNFEKLITEGDNKEFCTTGALWILSALTIVSKNARDALPWLYQSAHPGT